ncbi:MAG: hypothetical protein ACXVAN_16780 [Polyangia bacterium]
MLTKIKLGFSAVSMVVLLAGCGAGAMDNGDLTADQDVDSAKEDSARKKSHPEFYKCDTDADCVAVDKAGCCPNGFLVAVNKNEVKAYDDKYACTTPPAACPLFVVHDTRVAQCDFQKHSCQMIDPTQIRCGGFIAPAMQHHCPTGYECHYQGVPDLPGSCVASSTSN